MSWCSITDDSPMEPQSPQILGRQRISGFSLVIRKQCSQGVLVVSTQRVSHPYRVAWVGAVGISRENVICCIFEVGW